MAFDSYSLSTRLSAGAEPSEFESHFLQNLSRMGRVTKTQKKPGGTYFVFRPKGAILYAKAKIEATKNDRTGDTIVLVRGKTTTGFLIGLMCIALIIATSGIATLLVLPLVLFTYRKPRECLDDAMKTAAQVA